MEKLLLLGAEAIAQGAIDGGMSGVYAYPGTPSTEITEYVQHNKTAVERKLHSQWSANEKTAMEAGLGMSYAGKRAMVCICLLYTSDAADERSSVDLGGRRIIKKKKMIETRGGTLDHKRTKHIYHKTG